MASVSPLAALWAANRVAVIGASTRDGSPGNSIIRYLDRFGYAGDVIPVHPTAPAIVGHPAWPSLAAYAAGGGGPVDLAVILVPAAAAVDAVLDCGRAGVKVAIVGSSGFAETGPDGAARQDALVAAAARVGVRVVGPNCIGALGVAGGLVASFSPLFGGADTRLVAGGIGFASASGALGFGTVSLALERGLGLHAAVSTGNEADVSALEVLAAMAADPRCTALLGYVESLSDRAGLRHLAAAAAGKPVALLVAGVSEAGAKAAASHTGALATGDRVVDGLLRQHGIVRVTDVEDLLDAGFAFAARADGQTGDNGLGVTARAGGPIGRRVAVVTTSGGSGILAADEISRAGLVLAELAEATTAELRAIVPAFGSAENPVDVTATVMNDRTLVRRALNAVAADPNVDAIVVCFCVLTGADADAVVDALADVKSAHGTPIVVARTGADHLAPNATSALRAIGIPSYPTPARAVRAAAALHRANPRVSVGLTVNGGPRGVAGGAVAPPADFRNANPIFPSAPAEPPPEPPPTELPAAEPSDLGESGLKALLASAAIRVPVGRVVDRPEDVAHALVECGGRAVFKVVAPGLVHKTEAGGVAVGVDDRSAAATYERMARIDGATGVLVEELVDGGVEALVGVTGGLLTVGVGGVLAEIVDDVAVRLLPVGRDDVRDMISETRLGRLLAGVRGAPPGDTEAFVDLVMRVGELAGGWAGDLDLNPVVVRAHDAVVLDAAYLSREN